MPKTLLELESFQGVKLATRKQREAAERNKPLRKKGTLDPALEKKIKIGLGLGVLVILIVSVFDAIPLIGAKGTLDGKAVELAAAAASAAKGKPVTTATAVEAYNAAINRMYEKGMQDDITIVESSFKVNPDGTVSLDVTQEVNSFFLKKLPMFADWYSLKASATNGPLILN